jgi:translation initiation factor 1
MAQADHITLRRETKGRKGKGVTLVEGFGGDSKVLKSRAKMLKQLCGCGGSVTGKGIEIQGDQRQMIKAALEKEGFKVKLAGG